MNNGLQLKLQRDSRTVERKPRLGCGEEGPWGRGRGGDVIELALGWLPAGNGDGLGSRQQQGTVKRDPGVKQRSVVGLPQTRTSARLKRHAVEQGG